ncbi:MAG: metal dependent phosphohydrolase [Clostridia bacterium]|nr:metal dependent phosphohydrolase [Clostridia bacterium]
MVSSIIDNEFIDKINDYVKKSFKLYKPEKAREKVIHDPIWGSVLYYGWEIQLIDSPVFQRLRDIHQLGMADLTYPAARHSRLEHSLGTVAIASRMMEKLFERCRQENDISNSIKITYKDIYKVRLSALLHDIGHCLYSHLSEIVYGLMPEFESITNMIKESVKQDIDPKPHEIFSYLIITSKNFINFFYKYIDFPDKGNLENCELLLKEVGNMVIGVFNFIEIDGILYRQDFMTQILNSDFDADKLDYTQRDSYTAGIALTYGVERFLLKIVIYKETNDNYINLRLAINSDTLTTVEELIFNRNILYVNMYHHQKIVATEAVIRDIIYSLVELKIIKHPCDFLLYTDQFIEILENDKRIPFPAIAPKRTLGDLVKKIKYRQLPKRCFELNRDVINLKNINEIQDKAIDKFKSEITGNQDFNINKDFLKKYFENFDIDNVKKIYIEEFINKINIYEYKNYIKIRYSLFETLCDEYMVQKKEIDFDVFDLHIVFPKLLKDKTSFLVITKSGDSYTTDRISYIKKWADAFNWDKWKGFIFSDDDIDRKIAFNASKRFLQSLDQQLEFKNAEFYIHN